LPKHSSGNRALILVTAGSVSLLGFGDCDDPVDCGTLHARPSRHQLDFLFLLALLWGANAAWQFGLSSSAALLMATPGHFLEKTTGILPLSDIWAAAQSPWCLRCDSDCRWLSADAEERRPVAFPDAYS
jgi:hypothetical protein